MLFRFATAIIFAVAAHAQFGMPLATNLEQSPNVSVVTVATNEPGRFIPGIPLSGTPDVWTGIRVHFRRDERATDYRVEVTYSKDGAEGTVIGYVRQHPIVLNGDGSAMLQAAEVRLSRDIFDFTVTRVWVSPLRAVARYDGCDQVGSTI